MVSKTTHQSNHTVLANSIDWDTLTVIPASGHCRYYDSALRLLLAHKVHRQLHSVHLTDQGYFQTIEFRLERIAVVIFVVEIIASIAEACVGHDNVNSPKFLLCPFEQSEKIFPASSIGLLEYRSVDRISRWLKVSDQHSGPNSGQVVYDPLSNARRSASHDCRLAAKLVA